MSSSSRASTKTKDRQRLPYWLAALAFVVLIAGVAIYLQKMRVRETILVEPAKATPSPLSPSEDVVAARALANYLVRIRAQVREHDAAYARLQQKKALSWNIREREEIERDRQIVRDFLSTNDRLADSLQHGEGFIRAELETAKVSPAARDAVLERYAKTQKPLLPLQMRIRDCDDVIGQNALAVLDLLDFNWGTWTRDDATGRIDFTNTITLATFRGYVGKIADAANDRKQAVDDLVNYQRSHPLQ